MKSYDPPEGNNLLKKILFLVLIFFMSPAMATTVYIYGSGSPTDNWVGLAWYDYNYADGGSTLQLSANALSNTYNNTPYSYRIRYRLGPSGYGGMGIHLSDAGINIFANYTNGDCLCFCAKTTTPAFNPSFGVVLKYPPNAGGNVVSSVPFGGSLTTNYKYFAIPLNQFTNSLFTKTNMKHLQRVEFKVYGNQNADCEVYIDEICVRSNYFPPSKIVTTYPSDGLVTNNRSLTLRWNAPVIPTGISNYQVILSTNNFFQGSVIRVAVKSNLYHATNLMDHQRWYWKVAVRDKKTVFGTNSDLRSFYVNYYPLPLKTILTIPLNNVVTNTQNVRLNWAPTGTPNGFKEYVVTCSTNAAFTGDVRIVTNFTTSLLLTNLLDRSTYYWKTYVSDSSNVLGTNSDVWSFRTYFGHIPYPTRPSLLSPPNGISTTAKNIKLSWTTSQSPVALSNYLVTAGTNASFTPIIFSAYTTITNYTLTNLSKGKWFWQIKPISIMGFSSSNSDLYDFTIIPYDPNIDFMLLTPPVGVSIPANAIVSLGQISTMILSIVPAASAPEGRGMMQDKKPTLAFKLEISASTKTPEEIHLAKQATITVTELFSPQALYYFDGVQWIKLGGTYANGTLTFIADSLYQQYALFPVSTTSEFIFTAISGDGFFSPNGDGANDTLRFYFENPENGKVTLTILNLKGKTVRTIDNLQSGQGWDGKESSSSASVVKSGPYLYKLVVGNKKITGTLVLVK